MKNPYAQKPWLNQYDKFVPQSLLYPDLNIPQILERSVEEFPDQICLQSHGQELSYKEVSDASDNLARWLLFLGIGKGDRVGLIFPNSPQFVIAFFAVQKIGAIVVAINPFYKNPEQSRIIEECDIRCILCMEEQIDILNEISTTIHIDTIIVSSKEDFKKKDFGRQISKVTLDDHDISAIESPISFTRCIEQRIKNIPLDFSFSPNSPAVYQYSGGTTGTPKAAIGLHRNIVANTIQFMTWCDLQIADEVFLAAIPFYHVYGMVLVLLLGIRVAARIILIEDARDIDSLLQSIAEQRVTFFPGVPNIYATIIRNPAVREGKYNLKSVKACISGSAPLHPHIKTEFEKLTGGKLVEGYGLSEAPTATHCNPLFGENKSGSFGLPLPDVECRIVDVNDESKIMDIGEEGELLIKGPQVMARYYQNSKETAATLKSGWLHTGDIVRMDEEGYFYFIDRKKDLIKIGGFQVWPKEIEEVLITMKGIRGAAVAGVQTELGEEKVAAWLVLEEGMEIKKANVRDYCRKFLTAYKIPKEIYFIEEIPRTSVGKILRRELVRSYYEKRL
ncbi:MAG: long-chain fatty acid--CoA ligase [Anaerolineaceae bacterium]